jgi:hypothetical protein
MLRFPAFRSFIGQRTQRSCGRADAPQIETGLPANAGDRMKRKKKVRPDDLRGKPWLWVEHGDGAANGAPALNPADALIIEAWFRSMRQAVAEGFDTDDAEDLGSEAMMELMKRVAKNPTWLERPTAFERRRRYITKTMIYNWRRTGRRAKAGQEELKRFLEAYLPGWMFADRKSRVQHGKPPPDGRAGDVVARRAGRGLPSPRARLDAKPHRSRTRSEWNNLSAASATR